MSLDQFIRIRRNPQKWSAHPLQHADVHRSTMEAVRAGRVARANMLEELRASPLAKHSEIESSWSRLMYGQAISHSEIAPLDVVRIYSAGTPVHLPRKKGDMLVIQSDSQSVHRGRLLSIALDEDGATWVHDIRGLVRHRDDVMRWCTQAGASSVDDLLERRRIERESIFSPDKPGEKIDDAIKRLELRRVVGVDEEQGDGLLFLEYGEKLVTTPIHPTHLPPGVRGREIEAARKRVLEREQQIDRAADRRADEYAAEREAVQRQQEAADRARAEKLAAGGNEGVQQ